MNEIVTADRLPPQSREAERGVIGSILRDNLVLSDVLQIIRPQNFYFDFHQKIFSVIIELYNEGKPIDLVLLHEALKQRKLLEDIGGITYLTELWDLEGTAANAEYYARIVREKSIVRELIHASNEVLRDAYDGQSDAEHLLGNAERKIMEISERGQTGELYSLAQTLSETITRIDERHSNSLGVSGLPYGYTDLDNLTAGLHRSELVILAARPSVGKTAVALNIVRNIAVDERKPVFFVSLEMSRLELAERLLCCQGKINSQKLRKGQLNHHEISNVMKSSDQLRGNSKDGFVKLFIDDAPAQTMLRIAANARRLKLRHKIELVVIDYLQLIEPENRRDPRQEQVAQTSRRLKFLAKELEIPVLALAQVNRSAEDRQDHKPRVSDLRESGSIEQDADTVILLHRPGRYTPDTPDNILEVIIGKQRNGPTDELKLTFLSECMRFENYTPEHGAY